MRKEQIFTGITSQGGLLPADFLAALSDPKSSIEGLDPVTFRLAPGERLGEQVNRSWNRLKGCWANFQRALAAKEPGDPTTTETRERWLLPLFQELDFGRLTAAKPLEIDGRAYSVSHGWGPVPIHLVGSHVDLDRRTPGAVGAAKASPHSLVQQVLNASDDHLWGIISNGFIFRLLRDNLALTRQAFVEWDLQAIFDGDLYPEFFLLWVVCHQSRFEVPPGGRSEQCWMEKWRKQAEDTGLRALENLRPGVEQAISVLGTGLISHKSNQGLREKLSSGALSTQDFYRQILRLIYRLLFLLVAEDRNLLHPPLPGEEAGKDSLERAIQARRRYNEFYSIGRLRSLTRRRAGTPHPDLWQVFQFVAGKLGSDAGCPELALPALGSFLWSSEATPDLNACQVSNRQFLEAVHALAFIRDGNVRRTIDYKNLGSEELGSVYESLLELHPIVNADAGTFELQTAAGHERKTSGSYYTPDSLVQCLLDSALEPVMDEAVKGKEGPAAAEALLNLKICDPAVGSGHFLIAAAHRLAKRVAAARTGEEEPSPEATRTALRDVIGRCLYGVDINPMAAELCRVNLWLESLEPGKPLSFLNHHIRVGNSLLGTTPELIATGLPDEAFSAVEGDDKEICKAWKRRNKEERDQKLRRLFDAPGLEASSLLTGLAQDAKTVDQLPDSVLSDIETKRRKYESLLASSEYSQQKLLADAWCAAFVWKKSKQFPYGVTTEVLRDLTIRPDSIQSWMHQEIVLLAEHYQFFHWHLAFPEVFAKGGFDCVLGNPPFLGGLKISENYGSRYRSILTTFFKPFAGRADLCAAFFRKSFTLISPSGRIGLIATKTIGQGETRESGLAVLLQQGAQILMAQRFVTWPGTANVEVSLLVLAKTKQEGNLILDDKLVPFISSRLDNQPEITISQLSENRGMAFQGSIVLGEGFLLSPELADKFIREDPRNAECLFPYYSGEDINTSPLSKPSRWVIQFDERTEEEARSYILLWEHVLQHVYPIRQSKDASKYPRMVLEWWKHWNNRQELYTSVRSLSRVLARSRVSELHMLAFLPSTAIYSDATVVFAFDDYQTFALLQSDVHEVWVRREASTMRTDVRYTPTDCFTTFPFPEISEDCDGLARELVAIGEQYYCFRQDTLNRLGLGLTKLYNLMHNPACKDTIVLSFRQLHALLTQAVLAVYFWTDIELEYEFRLIDRNRVRYCIAEKSRVEILHRLNQLNACRGHR